MELTEVFPTPWKIVDNGTVYIVKDARGRGIGWFYYRREDALRDTYASPEQALLAARAFARLSKAEPST
jgi:hypothetical protein